jgi:hypothetical protein
VLQNIKQTNGWLMIIYKLPSTPSTSRVTVWKKVKELGAYLLQQSVYILPDLPQVKEAINNLKDMVYHFSGEIRIIEIASLGEDQEKEVINGFNNSREEEYTEVVKACNELLREIDEESKTEDFHFADLEENEKHLQRVKELLDSVAGRDYFGSSLQAKAVALMKECQQKFEEFSHEVFSREVMVIEDRKLPPEPRKRHKERQSLSKIELSAKIQEIIGNLNSNVLEVNGKIVRELPDTVVLEWEYVEQKTEKSLEMKIEWTSSRAGKKS